MATIPPTSDGALLPWSLNFSTRITATPTVFDLTAAEATAYAALHADYTARVATAENPGTRTKATIAEKTTSKLALLAKARQFCKIIKANPDLTDAQRALLGLPPRDATPTPVPAPLTRPLLAVDPFGNVRIVDETTPNRRGKPQGVMGAVIITAILPTTAPAPTTPQEGHYSGLATRDKFAIPLPSDSNGKALWAMAQWVNPRGEPGPVSAPVRTLIAA